MRLVTIASLAVAFILGGCGALGPATPPSASPPPSTMPSPSAPTGGAPAPSSPIAGPSVPVGSSSPDVVGLPGVDWDRAPSVERPDVVVPQAMPSSYYHPGHFEGQAYVAAVTVVPGGRGFVAVGYDWPGWHALAWTSADALTWHLIDLGETDGTFMNAVAAGVDSLVAVGRDGNDAAIWISADGRDWSRATSPAFRETAHLRIASVAARPAGASLAEPTAVRWVAGGAAGPDIGSEDARLWISTDGRTWGGITPPGATGARVAGIAADGSVAVAVGWRGSERTPTGSAVWTSTDGRTWTPAPDSTDLKAGQMVGVSVAPGGHGFVAVGTDADQREAIVWLSRDGRTWTRIASPTFGYHDQKVRMTAVATTPTGIVAVGNYLFGTQYGFARVWTSPDGRDWTVAPESATFGQGEMLGVAATPSRAVAVGTFGAPDSYIPTIWISPPAP